MGGVCDKSTNRKTQEGGGCGCNSSSPALYGGYMYSRKASLASRKRLQNRLSTKTRKKKNNRRKKKKHKTRHRRRRRGTRRRRRRRR